LRCSPNPSSSLSFPSLSAEEIKLAKSKEYEEKKAQVKRNEAAREPDLLNKLDEIVDRVVGRHRLTISHTCLLSSLFFFTCLSSLSCLLNFAFYLYLSHIDLTWPDLTASDVLG